MVLLLPALLLTPLTWADPADVKVRPDFSDQAEPLEPPPDEEDVEPWPLFDEAGDPVMISASGSLISEDPANRSVVIIRGSGVPLGPVPVEAESLTWLARPMPETPRREQRRGVEADCVVTLIFSREGVVTSMTLDQTSCPVAFYGALIEVMPLWRAEPVLWRAVNPVPVEFTTAVVVPFR